MSRSVCLSAAGLLLTFSALAIPLAGRAVAAEPAAYGTPAPATQEDWYMTIGVSGRVVPDYPGADDYTIRPGAIFSIRKASELNVFRSVDDNPSIALFDTGTFRAGAVGRLDWGRDQDDSDRLLGLGDVDYSLELGGFAEWYPVDWLRFRGELRYGFGGYDGIVGGLGADAIWTAGQWRFAAGPRLSFAGSGYMNAYFGVTPEQSALATALGNPLPVYAAGGGFNLVGATAQLTYNFGNGFETGVFGSYGYLLGDASASPVTADDNQFMAGLSMSYTFNIGKAWW